jgi:hypothetical protein
MSDPDYDQCAEDHQSLLVVVKQIGLYLFFAVFSDQLIVIFV